MNDQVNSTDTNWNWNEYSSTQTTVPNFNPLYCQYRLPCGYCERLKRECPKPATQKSYTVTLNGSQN